MRLSESPPNGVRPSGVQDAEFVRGGDQAISQPPLEQATVLFGYRRLTETLFESLLQWSLD